MIHGNAISETRLDERQQVDKDYVAGVGVDLGKEVQVQNDSPSA